MKPMSNDREILDLLECVRPGSDDLASPEFARASDRLAEDSQLAVYFARAQSSDEAIRAAMDDVPVPAGLAARLLARVEADASQEVDADSTSEPVAPAHSIEPVPAAEPISVERPLIHRRRWIAASLAVAASVVVAVGISMWRGTNVKLGSEDVAQAAWQWHQNAMAGPETSWQTFSKSPTDLPRSLQMRPREYRVLSTEEGRATVYALTPRSAQHKASLIVMSVDPDDDSFATSPPERPISTQGRSIAVWREGSNLFVLVVEGPEQNYRRFINAQSRPMA